jgi:hypothetical protein
MGLRMPDDPIERIRFSVIEEDGRFVARAFGYDLSFDFGTENELREAVLASFLESAKKGPVLADIPAGNSSAYGLLCGRAPKFSVSMLYRKPRCYEVTLIFYEPIADGALIDEQALFVELDQFHVLDEHWERGEGDDEFDAKCMEMDRKLTILPDPNATLRRYVEWRYPVDQGHGIQCIADFMEWLDDRFQIDRLSFK